MESLGSRQSGPDQDLSDGMGTGLGEAGRVAGNKYEDGDRRWE